MRKNLFGTLLLAGVCSLVPLSLPALAQQQSPVQQGGIQGGGTPMNQRTQEPQSPNINGPMSSDQTAPMKTQVDDKKFVKEAAQGNMSEIEMGKLALQKSSNQDVKNFAQTLVCCI